MNTACFAREVEDQSSGKVTLHHPLGGEIFRPTNHRYGHQLQAMMLLCEHPAYCRMRERSINISACVLPARATRELLSIWAISG